MTGGNRKDFDAEYVENYKRNSYRRLQRLLPLIDFHSDDVVCDYGCGNGMLLELIHSKVGFYCGVDFSEDFIDATRQMLKQKNYSNCEFICSGIVDFCRTHRNTFTKAFAFDFSTYLSNSEFVDVFEAIKLSLKDAASLYIHVPDGIYVLEKLKRTKIGRRAFQGYVPVRNCMTASDYTRILTELGYKELKVQFLPNYNFLGMLHFLRDIPILGRFLNARLFILCRK